MRLERGSGLHFLLTTVIAAGFRLAIGAVILLLAISASAQNPSAVGSSAAKKLCVARVANGSGKPIAVDVLQAELVKQLTRPDIQPVATPTSTMLASQLDLSSPNQNAFRALQCDFMLLSEVAEADASTQAKSGSAVAEGVNKPAMPGGPRSIGLRFAIFSPGKGLLLRDMAAASGDDPFRAALAAVPMVADRVQKQVAPTK